MNSGKTLVLVDGSSLAFRSFFALFTTGLRTKSGVPTWAILGFFNSLFELIEKYKPEMLAVCFDMAAPTFRHKEFEDYKANRAEMPDDLAVQWPILKEGVAALGLPVYELAGYEADDIIGSLARLAESKQIKVLILTGDQDAFQLVDGQEQIIKVLMPVKGGLQLYGREEVFAKLGVWPEQITDYKGLCGDSSDNIPGVKGIGPKTAVNLLSEFKSVEGVYQNIEAIKSNSLKAKLTEGKELAITSKRLATIRLDVPISFDFEHCHLTTPPLEKVESFFADLEFKSLKARLPRLFSNFRSVTSQEDLATYGDATAQDTTLPKVSGNFTKALSIKRIGAPYAVSLSPQNAGQLSLSWSQTDSTNNQPHTGTPQEIEVKEKEIDWQLIDSAPRLNHLIDELSQRSALAFAVQSSGDHWTQSEIHGYAFSWNDRIVCDRGKVLTITEVPKDHDIKTKGAYIPFNYLNEQEESLDSVEINKKLKPIFLNPAIGKIVANSKQVSNILSTIGVCLGPLIFDPVLASYVVSPDEKHGLGEQARRILDYSAKRPTSAPGARKQASLNTVPMLSQAEYSIDDAQIALKISEHYCSIMDADQKYLLNEMEIPLSLVLASMEQFGVALDLPYLSKFSKELEADIQRLESEVFKHANRPFNINSTQQLAKVLFEDLGLKTKTKTKTGYSTDASVLESLRDKHPIVAYILEYRQLTKLRSTYVEALPKLVSPRDKRLHAEFNQTNTSTGRLSSSNPNLQNIPIKSEIGRRMRRAFIPGSPNYLLLSADYSQIELRLLAHMSGDDTLIDAFRKDQDVHARTAQEIFDVEIEKVTPDMRRIGKTLNFALIYQQGPYATSQQLGISVKEATSFIEKYFSRYAKVRAFLDETITTAKQNGYVETLWKRRRYFRHLNDRNDVLRKAEERAACNAPLQGSAADLMKLAMIKLDEQLAHKKLRAKLILQVHDELVLELPEGEVAEASAIMVEAMLLNQPLVVPLKVDIGVGKNWMDAK